ncbi:MAG: 3-keto-5-aminohexanoate cleavage protein [Myxococcales bacterium]|nr:3-keto-5-aminohexanoate cleavage protein [Myxococcales bacterium]
MSDPNQPAIISCALTGVLTDPKRHPVPVTPKEMADEAERAFNAGATIVHLHFRDQREGLGHLPTWDPGIALEISNAIRQRCPELLLNFSTGVMGEDISAPVSCLAAGKPEIAALNAGSLNYLKLRSNGEWAWFPLLFANPVEKIAAFVEAMQEHGVIPECECFDTGIIRSVGMFYKAGLLTDPLHVSLVMGVASGMPAKKEWLPLLIAELPEQAHWQTIVIGRQEVWDVHRASAELGGHLRTGLEDTFYLPSGERATSNGQLIEALVQTARDAGRRIATPAQTRASFGLA